jgi:3-deoxy-D-manno-octulosonic-acid transferase
MYQDTQKRYLINNFGSIGQHNVMEPLREGCSVICGTHSENILCNDIIKRLKAHNDPQQDEDEIQNILSLINFDQNKTGIIHSIESIFDNRISIKTTTEKNIEYRKNIQKRTNAISNGILEEICTRMSIH